MANQIFEQKIGTVTAYGYAKKNGYSGTEAEFGQHLARCGTYADTASVKAAEAGSSANMASVAGGIAENAAARAEAAAASLPASVENWLSENITVTEGVSIDASLTIPGAAGEAKAAGEQLGGLKSSLKKYNAENVLLSGEQVTKTHNSTTFTWSGKETCHVVCTASSHSVSLCNLFYSLAALPAVFEPGKRYYMKYQSTVPSGQRCLCDVMVFRNGNVNASNPDMEFNKTTDFSFVLPADATGIIVRLRLIANYTVEETIRIALLNAKTNAELLDSVEAGCPYYGYEEYGLVDGTHNGITYRFDKKTNRCHLTGTSTATSFRNIYYDVTKLPDGLKPGDTFLLHFYSSSAHIACTVYFRLSDGTDFEAVSTTIPATATVPANAVGMFLRYYVYRGYTLDDYATIPLLCKTEKQTILPFKAKRPWLVSFIDDDTSTDELVTKFYQSCRHNGVVGSFAVCTKQYDDGDSSIGQLLDYQAEGFNMFPHCLEQKQYLNPSHADYDRVLAFKNYAQCLKDFGTLGLLNPQKLWIIPYGSSGEETVSMAKELGFEMAFTVSGEKNNDLTMNDKYRMHRCGLSPLSEVVDDTDPNATGSMAKCKARVDELVSSETGGWLIIMTHYNTWQSETWNTSPDANGFPVGYARFNELAQYVKAKGCTVVSMAEGAAFMKPMIDRNFTMG